MGASAKHESYFFKKEKLNIQKKYVIDVSVLETYK